jgi:hypothetical protein
MTPRELEEYKALRATIRERGTARVWVFIAGLAVWAALVVATTALTALPAAALLTLFFLAATFEAVFTLHVGVERVGRYLQVFHEAPGDRASWEAVAMAAGSARGAAADPLFIVCFAIATMLNFTPVLLAAPVAVEVLVIGAAHLVFLTRMLAARRAARGQRAADLARFLEMQTPRKHEITKKI